MEIGLAAETCSDRYAVCLHKGRVIHGYSAVSHLTMLTLQLYITYTCMSQCLHVYKYIALFEWISIELRDSHTLHVLPSSVLIHTPDPSHTHISLWISLKQKDSKINLYNKIISSIFHFALIHIQWVRFPAPMYFCRHFIISPHQLWTQTLASRGYYKMPGLE